MRLSDLQGRKVPTALEYDGETVKVIYRPAVHTSEFEDEMRAAIVDNDAKALAGLLAKLVDEIDVLDDDGAQIPCTDEVFYRLLPLDFMARVWEAIGTDMRPGEAKGETSDAG